MVIFLKILNISCLRNGSYKILFSPNCVEQDAININMLKLNLETDNPSGFT